MLSVTKKAHLFLAAFLLVLVGSSSDIFAQGKGTGGDRGGGGGKPAQAQPQPRQQQPQRMERPQQQRQMPQMNRQAQQPQRAERPQQQRQMPQMNRQAQRPQRMERPQQQRQMPEMNRQAQRPQRMERPQQQRQMPQMDRQAQRPQRMERQQQQRQMPQMNRQAQRAERPQRMERQQQQRQMPQMNRQEQRAERPERLDRSPRQREIPQMRERGERNDQRVDRGNAGKLAQMERQLPGMSQPEIRSGDSMDRRRGRDSMNQRGDQVSRPDSFGNYDGRNDRDSFVERSLRNSYSGDRRGSLDWSSGTDYRTFDDREQALRQQARYEGRAFSSEGFRDSVYYYNQREAWRDNIFRSVISANLGYQDYPYYVAPPSYVNYYDVSYDPRFYNVGNSYYDPYYSSFYVEPYSHAYRPYDAYYGSYYYDDPYSLGDPYEDYMTYQVVSSGSVGGFVSRILSNLIGYGYEQGYRDGQLARQTGYVEEYYDDPYVYDADPYQTVSYYEPYSVNAYENRRCLSEGYELGYRDAVYGEASGYVPEYRSTDLVTLWIGASYQIA